ncbi:unnamed protein product [Parnassius apollo]|uniref:(apollo) hypothetical protein n=1 Tax=Parnassius apollo TaxID=110799 RepID=A0A8S3X3D9_PARAO|nr:unnamed protein product [Parnassius apollo]
MCIDILNNKLTISYSTSENKCTPITDETSLKSTNVKLLSQVSKKDSEFLPFVANQKSELPQCLRTQKDEYHNKISFEELVLERIRQDKNDNTTKKKRVAKGAEVFTLLKQNKEKEKDVKKTQKPKTYISKRKLKTKKESGIKFKRRSSTYSMSD